MKLEKWWTTCGCGARAEVLVKPNAEVSEVRMVFALKGWLIKPTRCPKCKGT